MQNILRENWQQCCRPPQQDSKHVKGDGTQNDLILAQETEALSKRTQRGPLLIRRTRLYLTRTLTNDQEQHNKNEDRQRIEQIDLCRTIKQSDQKTTQSRSYNRSKLPATAFPCYRILKNMLLYKLCHECACGRCAKSRRATHQ